MSDKITLSIGEVTREQLKKLVKNKAFTVKMLVDTDDLVGALQEIEILKEAIIVEDKLQEKEEQ